MYKYVSNNKRMSLLNPGLLLLILMAVAGNCGAASNADYLYEDIKVGMDMADVSKKVKKLQFNKTSTGYTATATLFRKNHSSDVIVIAGKSGKVYKINKKIYFEDPKPTIKEMANSLVEKFGTPDQTIARNLEYHLCWGGCISGNRYDLTKRTGTILMVSVLTGYMTVSYRDVGLDYQNRN